MTTAPPPLTRVNKSIRNASLAIFYGDNPFTIRLFDFVEDCAGNCSSICPVCRPLKVLRHFSEMAINGPGTSALSFIRDIKITVSLSRAGDNHSSGDRWMRCIRMHATHRGLAARDPISPADKSDQIGGENVKLTTPEAFGAALVKKYPSWPSWEQQLLLELERGVGIESSLALKNRQARYTNAASRHWCLLATLAKECPRVAEQVYLEDCPVAYFEGIGRAPVT